MNSEKGSIERHPLQPQNEGNTSSSAPQSIHQQPTVCLTTLTSTSASPPTRAVTTNQSPRWLAQELLKRTDVSNGEICMFHYPMVFLPNMNSAFAAILNDVGDNGSIGGATSFTNNYISNGAIGNSGVNSNGNSSTNNSTHNGNNNRNLFFPRFNEEDIHQALELILNENLDPPHGAASNSITRVGHYGAVAENVVESNDNNGNGNDEMEIDAQGPLVLAQPPQQAQPQSLLQPEFMENATQESRDQINRLQFSWYQFPSFPREIVGRTFRNVQHLDIRQNATLTCIKSIIAQLPHLVSLNLSDCPNICTLAPLATALCALPSFDEDAFDGGNNYYDNNGEHLPPQRTLNLRHLWVRGCNLSTMSDDEWAIAFGALSKSTGPLERLTMSRNKMSYLHGGIGKLKSLTYLFVEDNDGAAEGGKGFGIPEELGSMQSLRFASFSGNNITRLPRTMGRLNDECDVHLHRNPNLTYPPFPYKKSVKMMRHFFHNERMALLRGTVLFMPHIKRAQWRANERLYQPGGWGYLTCKERFEESVRRTSVSLMSD